MYERVLTEVVGIVAYDIAEVARCGSPEVHRHQVTEHDGALEDERSSKGVLHGVDKTVGRMRVGDALLAGRRGSI